MASSCKIVGSGGDQIGMKIKCSISTVAAKICFGNTRRKIILRLELVGCEVYMSGRIARVQVTWKKLVKKLSISV